MCMRSPWGPRSKRLTASAFPARRPASCGRPLISSTETRRFGGTAMPTARANSSMTNSFSGTTANCAEGSLTIHTPPIPPAGIVSPSAACKIAENFNWTPASENRRTGSPGCPSRRSCSGASGWSDPLPSSASGVTVSPPGRSAPSAAKRKNSRSGLTRACAARYVRRYPSGRRFEKKGGTRAG